MGSWWGRGDPVPSPCALDLGAGVREEVCAVGGTARLWAVIRWGRCGLLPLVLERVGGKRHHGGRVSRVPGADVASVHFSAWPGSHRPRQAGALCSLLPAGVPSPATYAPRLGVLENSHSLSASKLERALLIRTFALAFPALKNKTKQINNMFPNDRFSGPLLSN